MPIQRNHNGNKSNGNGRKEKASGFKARKTLATEKKRRAPETKRVFIIQNNLRRLLGEVRPRSMKPLEEEGTGRDYVFSGISIDEKYSFGHLKQGNIIVRSKNKQLLNKSKWTMVIDINGKVRFFPTTKLAQYIEKNWERVNQSLLENKTKYKTHAINLEEFIEHERPETITCQLTKKSLLNALKEIREREKGKEQRRHPFAIFMGRNRQLSFGPNRGYKLGINHRRKNE
jgi:hypothetical protein